MVQSTGLRTKRPGLKSLHVHQVLCDFRVAMAHSINKWLSIYYVPRSYYVEIKMANKTQFFLRFAV